MPNLLILYAPDAQEVARDLNAKLPAFALNTEERKTLASQLQDAFSLDELKVEICFDLGIPYESITGNDNHSVKVRSLILWAEGRGRLDALAGYAKLTRPQKQFAQAKAAICQMAFAQQQTRTSDYDNVLDYALAHCDGVIMIASRQSVAAGAAQLAQARRAVVSHKKPLMVLRHGLASGATLPALLGGRKQWQTAEEVSSGVAAHLEWLNTPDGRQAQLREWIDDLQRDLANAAPNEQARLRDALTALQSELQTLRQDTDAAQTERRIESGLERERQPAQPVSGNARSRFINRPPAEAPSYFQDRHYESKQLAIFLREGDNGRRLAVVLGRGGAGKTALVCRLLRGLEHGLLPDDLGALSADGIVYLSMVGGRKVSFEAIFADLCKLLPAEAAQRLESLGREAKTPSGEKMHSLLQALGEAGLTRVVLLLDNFEDLITPDSAIGDGYIADGEVNAALTAILTAPAHPLKVILTSRERPFWLMQAVQPARQAKIELDAGLPSPHAENMLREMDADGRLGLAQADAARLGQVRELTRGYPRALEAVYGWLNADRDATLEQLLKTQAPDNVTEALVGQAYQRLDPAAQRVLQALAVYGRPVSPTAVDYLLQAFVPNINSAALLRRLSNMHFARYSREGGAEGRYYLHPIDRAYALDQVPIASVNDNDSDTDTDGDSAWALPALSRRAADYFAEIRQPRANWKTLDDLQAQLDEFELRKQAGEWDEAARVLEVIGFNYLWLWGHVKLWAQLGQSLLGKLQDADLRQNHVGNLGLAYSDLGEVVKAIGYYEQALSIAREIGNRSGEGAWLGNLGNAYSALGEVDKAIGYYEQALSIARGIGDRHGEETWLGSLGNVYYLLGEVVKTIGYHEQALSIIREIGDRHGEGSWLGNLGIAYHDLGEVVKAIGYCEQALSISRETGNKYVEGVHLGSLANSHIYIGHAKEAEEFAKQALAIGLEIQSPQVVTEASHYLTQAYAMQTQFMLAEDTIAQGLAYDWSLMNAANHTLHGIVLLRQGKAAPAQAAFAQGRQHASAMLAKNERSYAMHYTHALALRGLAGLCPDPAQAAALSAQSAAAEAAARAIFDGAGAWQGYQRLLGLLGVGA